MQKPGGHASVSEAVSDVVGTVAVFSHCKRHARLE